MRITRDALYEQIHIRLPGIDGIWLAVQAGDYEAANRLAREFSDELRLVIDDLGWGEEGGGPLDLSTPPEVLRRIFTRMQGKAEFQQVAEEKERAESRRQEEQTQRLLDLCQRVLGELEEQGTDGE